MVVSVVEIALPARPVTLTLTLGPEDGVTPLEDYVARAVDLGCATVLELERLFGLNHNMVLDVVHSLWSKGFLVVDFTNNRVELSDGARDLLADPGGTLAVGAVETRTQEFLFEPVTGRVLLETAAYAGAASPRAQVQVPVDHPADVHDLSPAALLDAVSRLFRREADGALRDRIVDLSFGSPVLRPVAETRWVPLKVSVHQDPVSGRVVTVPVGSGSEWDVTARRRLAEHIARTLQSEPRHPFSLFLAGKASGALAAPATVEELLDDVDEVLRELSGTLDEPSPDLRRGRQRLCHDKLMDLARRTGRRIGEDDATRAGATLVDGTEGRHRALQRLIGQAQRQLVVCSPLLSYAELYRLVEPLEPRLRDDPVRLVLLWGRQPSDVLATNVQTVLEDLRVEYPDQVVYSHRSSAVQAAFVAADDTSAWVGQTGPLERVPRDVPETGILIEPAVGGPARPRAVQELLYWARHAFPSRAEGLRIAVYPEEFGPVPPPERPEDLQRVLPRLPNGDDEEPDGVWVAAWQEFRAALTRSRARSEDVGPTVEVLSTGEWVDRAWTALRAARSRVVIGDSRPEVTAVSSDLRRELLERTREGVDVGIVSPAAGGGGAADDAADAGGGREAGWRADLTAAGVGTERRRSAPVLVVDDLLLLGPVPPLTLGASDGLRGFGLGLAVRGGAPAEQGCARVTGVPVDTTTATTRTAVTAPAPVSTAAAAALPLLQEAWLAARGPNPRGEFARVLRERLPRLDDPWLVFQKWQDPGVPVRGDSLRSLAAVLLSDGPWSDVPTATATRRAVLEWLLADAWSRRSFVEAAVVAAAHPTLSDRPSVTACLSAVPLELGPSGLDWITLASAAGSAEEAVVILAGSAADVLCWNALQALPALTILAEADRAAGRHWPALARAVRTYAETAPGAFPLAAVTTLVVQGEPLADDAEQWQRLGQEVEAVGQRTQRFNFSSGRILLQKLFDGNGLMTVIIAACRGGRSERDRILARTQETVKDQCDRIVAEAGFAPIAWARHQAFLNKLEDIVRTARDLAERGGEAQDKALASAEARALGSAVAACREGLWAEAAALEPPYDVPLRAMLALIEPVAQWGRTR